MKKEETLPGNLSVIDLTERENKMFLKYFESQYPKLEIGFLGEMLGADIYKWLDVLAGRKLNIPQREVILRSINDIKMYIYCRNHYFSEDSIKNAKKIFGKRDMKDTKSTLMKVGEIVDADLLKD